MPDVSSPQIPQTLSYPTPTVARAERSLRCSPFNLSLFTAMVGQTVPIKFITLDAGVKNGYTKRPLSELAVDNALTWLIQVGILRREVDGQGITDSFRLTPLGRQVVEKLQTQPWCPPTWGDRISNALTRWLRIPF